MEKKYLIKSILIRIICILLLLFSIRIWRINIDYYIGQKEFFDSNKAKQDYFDSKKEALKPEVQYVDNIYMGSAEEYVSDRGDYYNISFATKNQHFMRNFSYIDIDLNTFFKDKYSNPKIINNIELLKEIDTELKENYGKRGLLRKYNEKYFENGSLLLYYYEGDNSYICDVFSIVKKINETKVAVEQTCIEGNLNNIYKSSNAVIVYLEMAKMPDDTEIETIVNKVEPKIKNGCYAKYYQLKY